MGRALSRDLRDRLFTAFAGELGTRNLAYLHIVEGRILAGRDKAAFT